MHAMLHLHSTRDGQVNFALEGAGRLLHLGTEAPPFLPDGFAYTNTGRCSLGSGTPAYVSGMQPHSWLH